jgi:hypothetical protein
MSKEKGLCADHTPLYEEDTEVVEFSPTAEYQRTLKIVARNAAATEEPE